MADADSIRACYRRLIALGQMDPITVHGSSGLLHTGHEQINAYPRTLGDERLVVTPYFGAERPRFDRPDPRATDRACLMIANFPVDPPEALSALRVRPCEAREYHLG